MLKKVFFPIVLLCVIVMFGCAAYEGDDGSQVEITDEETIAAITENFNTLILNRDKKIDSTGWTYSVGWYDADGNELTKIYCGAQSDSITRDGYVWKIVSGSIDVDLLNDLLKIQ